MAGKWAVLNGIAEGDEDAIPEFPWYPYLFIGGCGFSMEVSFATEDECRSFIEEVVLGATLEEKE
jgi:hypothetical protein